MGAGAVESSVLRPGDTCWVLTRAERVSFLVDAAAYFAAFRHTVLRAKRSVVILGWDVDSRVRLVADQEPADGYPSRLLPFLNAVLVRRPELQIYVLAWDFSMIYAFERELWPAYKFGWRGHRRLRFALDSTQPLGASHHQKVVVVDDRVAFAGGLDLTIRRWDTPEHLAFDPRRVDPSQVPYAPIHDVQMMVEGETAAALGELARARWRMATGQTLLPRRHRRRIGLVGRRRHLEEDAGDSLWPTFITPDITPARMGIARTMPAASEDRCVREIQRLTLEVIAAARRIVFVENQYLTSKAVGDALGRRLAETDGPEVVLVLPRLESGWLEQSSMGILRRRLLARLRQADRHGRLRVYYPLVPGLADTACVNLHSKVLAIDDWFLKVGSANLSNRSMALDTECDLAIEAPTPDGVQWADSAHVREAIVGFRDRLLAEHLGVSPQALAFHIAERGSLGEAIDALRGGARTLASLDDAAEPALSLALFDGICDPERPIGASQFVDEIVPDPAKPPARRAMRTFAIAVAVLLALAVGTAISDRASAPGPLHTMSELISSHPLAPALVIGAFVIGAVAFVPITVLVGAMVLILPSPRGLLLAWVGALAAALATYAAGRALPRHLVQRLFGTRLVWLRGQVRRRGMLAVATLRLLPVGHFSITNIVLGALEVPAVGYALANALGLMPGIAGMTMVAATLRRVMRAPDVQGLALLGLALIIMTGGMMWLARVLSRGSRDQHSAVVIATPQGQGT